MIDALEQLAKDTRTRATLDGRRDRLMVEAREAGATWPAISRAAGLTELAVRNATRKEKGGVLPVPGGG